MWLGFVFDFKVVNLLSVKLLGGCLVCVVVIMGMLVLVYCWVFCVYSVKVLECNIFGFVGIVFVYEMLIGGVDGLGDVGVVCWWVCLCWFGCDVV